MTQYNGKELDEMTFEECLAALEELVKKLESGNLDLDKSMEVYEEAIVLRDRCKKMLTETDRKVQKLMESAEGLKKEVFKLE